jgi:hypothetical protein
MSLTELYSLNDCRGMQILLFIILSICTPVLSIPPFYNAAVDRYNVSCVYPLSGRYAFLQRLYFYLALTFAALAPRKAWIVAGAFVAFMTYAGVTAIHAVALSLLPRQLQVLDLDVVGCWCILSFAAIMVGPMLKWSASLRDSTSRPIIRFWGVLVLVGAICAYVTLNQAYTSSPACVDVSNQKTLTSPLQLVPGQFNCTYSCFSTHQLFRSPQELAVIPTARAFGPRFTAVFAVGICVFVVAIIGLFSSFKHNKSIPTEEFPSSSTDIACTKLVLYKWFIAAVFLPILVTTIVVNELYLLSPLQMPVADKAYSVGQWATWVSCGLVTIAAIVDFKKNGPYAAQSAGARTAQMITSI